MSGTSTNFLPSLSNLNKWILCAMQSAQTRVINRNLNPVWNEELTLSVPSPPQPLKVVSAIDTIRISFHSAQ